MNKLVALFKKGSDTLRFIIIGIIFMIVGLAIGALVIPFDLDFGLFLIVMFSIIAATYGGAALVIYLFGDDGNI